MTILSRFALGDISPQGPSSRVSSHRNGLGDGQRQQGLVCTSMARLMSSNLSNEPRRQLAARHERGCADRTSQAGVNASTTMMIQTAVAETEEKAICPRKPTAHWAPVSGRGPASAGQPRCVCLRCDDADLQRDGAAGMALDGCRTIASRNHFACGDLRSRLAVASSACLAE